MADDIPCLNAKHTFFSFMLLNLARIEGKLINFAEFSNSATEVWKKSELRVGLDPANNHQIIFSHFDCNSGEFQWKRTSKSGSSVLC